SAVVRAFERLQGHHVIHFTGREGFAARQAKGAKTLRRPEALEETLRQDEAKPSAIAEVSLSRDERHEHRDVFPAFAKDRVHPAVREQPIPLPQGGGVAPIVVGEALPSDPRRITDDVVTRVEKDRRERVLNDARPHPVKATLVKVTELAVERP